MSNELTLFLLLFARISGFFLVSPLFSNREIPKYVRFGLALVCSLLIFPPLTTQFSFSFNQPLLFAIQLFKELAIGYLLGFLFSLLIEAAAFAGQFIGTMMGFSASELLDPLATSSQPLLSRIFSVLVFLLFLALDLHHPLLRLLYESFETIPLTGYPFTQGAIVALIEGSTRLFHQALNYAIFPFFILSLVIVLFAFLSRFFSIFWIGFPIQLLVGFGAIVLSVTFFGQILSQAFYEFWALTKQLLFPL